MFNLTKIKSMQMLNKIKAYGLYRLSRIPPYSIGLHCTLNDAGYNLFDVPNQINKYTDIDILIIWYSIYNRFTAAKMINDTLIANFAYQSSVDKITNTDNGEALLSIFRSVVNRMQTSTAIGLAAKQWIDTNLNKPIPVLKLMLQDYYIKEILPFGNITSYDVPLDISYEGVDKIKELNMELNIEDDNNSLKKKTMNQQM